jgi:hypothetical protein
LRAHALTPTCVCVHASVRAHENSRADDGARLTLSGAKHTYAHVRDKPPLLALAALETISPFSSRHFLTRRFSLSTHDARRPKKNGGEVEFGKSRGTAAQAGLASQFCGSCRTTCLLWHGGWVASCTILGCAQ